MALEIIDNDIQEWAHLVELVKSWVSPLRLRLRVVEMQEPHEQLEAPAGYNRAEVVICKWATCAPVAPVEDRHVFVYIYTM